MTGTDDPTETLLEQALTRNAAQAPADDRLLDQVHDRIGRRRRTIRAAGGSVLAAAAVLAVITATSAGRELARPEPAGPGVGPVTGTTGGPSAGTAAPDGWRWESYGQVQLQVPQSWGYDGDPSQPCLAKPGAKPFVSRPGISTAVGCRYEIPDLGKRAAYVEFEGRAGTREFDHGWVREGRTIAGIVVTVFSDDPALRAQILASARTITGTDVNGCAPDHQAASDPLARPKSQGGLRDIRTVKSVSVCGYALDSAGKTPLFTGRTFTGTAATRLADAIQSAPEGSGPDDPPDTCSPGDLGERVYLLHVHGTGHDQQVVVRYAGCDHNGTDDGVTQRRLTATVLQPILTGADRLGAILSGAVGNLTR